MPARTRAAGPPRKAEVPGDEPDAAPGEPAAAAVAPAPPDEPITHPEELRGSVELRLGQLTVRASGRITPAGIVTGTIMVVGVMLSAVALVRAARAPMGRY